jgi:hypothetical protein
MTGFQHLKDRVRTLGSRWRINDILFGSCGLAMAAGATWFPFHVHAHPDRYGPPRMIFSQDRAGAQTDLRGLVVALDLRSGRFVAAGQGVPELDQTITGSIGRDRPRPVPAEVREPSQSPLTLLAADRSRALVADAEGVYLVRPSSRLPGGARVRALAVTSGRMQLETSDRQTIRRIPTGN